MHLDNSFPQHRGPEEGPERHQEVSAGEAGQVEQWVGDWRAGQYTRETHFLD